MHALPAVVLAVAAFAAGCAAPQEVACDDRVYVSIHYDRVLDGERLRNAFEKAGYATRPGPVADTTRLVPPGNDVVGLASVTPGPSGDGTILSFEGDEPGLFGANPAVEAARSAARLVNDTFAADPPGIDRWIVEGPDPAC